MSVFDNNSKLGKKIIDGRGLYKLLTLLKSKFLIATPTGSSNTPIYIDANGTVQAGETISALTNPEIQDAVDEANSTETTT